MYKRNTYVVDAGRDPNLRVGDAEREAISERLQKSHVEGRLDVQEFQDRIDRCYQAKTIGELERVVSDLPAPQATARPPRLPQLRPIRLVPIVLLILVVASAISHVGDIGFAVLFPLFFVFRFWLWPRVWGRDARPRSSEPAPSS